MVAIHYCIGRECQSQMRRRPLPTGHQQPEAPSVSSVPVVVRISNVVLEHHPYGGPLLLRLA